MAKTTRWATGKTVDYTPLVDVDAGTPVQVAGVVGIAILDIAAGERGALALDGHFKGAKAAASVTAGEVVGWDADGDPAVGEAGTGCYTTAEADWDFRVGLALYDADAAEGEVCFDLNRHPSELPAADAAEQMAVIPVEDLAAGENISSRPVFVHPSGTTLAEVGILTHGSPAGIDNVNTAMIKLSDDSDNTIVSKTYNIGTQPPDGGYESLGEPDATHKVLSAAEHAVLTVTQGTTADLPAFSLVLRYVPAND
jgi:predicted RecA/RadA family phage recombinase